MYIYVDKPVQCQVIALSQKISCTKIYLVEIDLKTGNNSLTYIMKV